MFFPRYISFNTSISRPLSFLRTHFYLQWVVFGSATYKRFSLKKNNIKPPTLNSALFQILKWIEGTFLSSWGIFFFLIYFFFMFFTFQIKLHFCTSNTQWYLFKILIEHESCYSFTLHHWKGQKGGRLEITIFMTHW